MQNQTAQLNLVPDACRAISGQLSEWGIDFSQERVAKLKNKQQNVLQDWINTGVEADETYQETFESLPEFMENELLEMSGTLSTEPQEMIIEQAINAYETESPITSNPYLFDTNAWVLWRKAYCRWHRGESLEFDEESDDCSQITEDEQSSMALNQKLKQIAPRLIQINHSLKELRRQLKKTKCKRKAMRSQQSQLLDEFSETFSSIGNIKCASLHNTEVVPEGNNSSVNEVPSINEQAKVKQAPCVTTTSSPIQIVRIPVIGPDTNRVEVYLQRDQEGHWWSGHLWSVVADERTGQLSRGKKPLDQKQSSFCTETAALMNEVLNLSQGIIGVSEIENQIIDYLNLLEEYPGQISVCSVCQRHYINDETDQPDMCPRCSTNVNA